MGRERGDDFTDGRLGSPAPRPFKGGDGAWPRLGLGWVLRPADGDGGSDAVSEPVVDRGQQLHDRAELGDRWRTGSLSLASGEALVGHLVVLGDRLSECAVPRQMLDEVGQESPAALTEQLGEVPAPEGEVCLYR